MRVFGELKKHANKTQCNRGWKTQQGSKNRLSLICIFEVSVLLPHIHRNGATSHSCIREYTFRKPLDRFSPWPLVSHGTNSCRWLDRTRFSARRPRSFTDWPLPPRRRPVQTPPSKSSPRLEWRYRNWIGSLLLVA